MYAVGVAAVVPSVLKQTEAAQLSKNYGLAGELAQVGGVGILFGIIMYVSLAIPLPSVSSYLLMLNHP